MVQPSTGVGVLAAISTVIGLWPPEQQDMLQPSDEPGAQPAVSSSGEAAASDPALEAQATLTAAECLQLCSFLLQVRPRLPRTSLS